MFYIEHSGLLLRPYGSITHDNKIVLYGAGAVGVQIENYLRKELGDNLVLWVDRNYLDLQSTLHVESPRKILSTDYDFIVISIMWQEKVESAYQDLITLGIPASKILWICSDYIREPHLLLEDLLKSS